MRLAVAPSFDRADVGRAVLCFGGIGADDVHCWQTLGPDLLDRHDVAVFVTVGGGLPEPGSGDLGELAAGIAGSVTRVAALCGFDLRIVTTAGYSAGCDLAVAVGSALDAVRDVVCVSGYGGTRWLPGWAYLVLRRQRTPARARALLRWRARWAGFTPRAGLRLTFAVGARRGPGAGATGLGALDEIVARRCTERFVRDLGTDTRIVVRPITTHSWNAWREDARRLIRGDLVG